jgi:hypothetical protein
MTTTNPTPRLSFAVLTPSRGLVHSRTIEAVEANISEAMDAGHDFEGWVLTHHLPIPDCHERVTELGLATGADALWFVEEDMIPPPGALVASLEVLPEAPIAAMNYPIGVGHPYGNCLPPDPINWCGLGCTLISRRVFEALDRPWFRVDGEWITDYGGQDISFGKRAKKAGFRIVQVPGVAGHALLRSWGRFMAQDGRHDIYIRDTIDMVRG